MSSAAKTLAQMRRNPRDWRIENLKTVAAAFGMRRRESGGSHVVFIRPDGQTFPVPAGRPIKPPYMRKFVAFVEGDNG